jgi:hypothetical protein
MHTMKIVNASHSSSIHTFMNMKIKLLNSNANIYFNRTCLKQNLTPQYAQIKLHSHNITLNTSQILVYKHTTHILHTYSNTPVTKIEASFCIISYDLFTPIWIHISNLQWLLCSCIRTAWWWSLCDGNM